MAKTESTNPTPHPEPTPPVVDPRQMFRARQSDSLAGGLIAGGKPGYQYTFIRDTDFRNPAEKAAKIQKLAAYGWTPAEPSAYAPDAPDASIYERPQATADAEWIADLAEVVKSDVWATLYRARPSDQRTLPPEVEDAMLAFHDPNKPPSQKPTQAQLVDLVFEYVRPHPGGARRAPAWGKPAPTKEK